MAGGLTPEKDPPMILKLTASALIFLAPLASIAWEMAIDCNQGEMTVDRDFADGKWQTQIVFRGHLAAHLVREGFIGADQLNEKGEHISASTDPHRPFRPTVAGYLGSEYYFTLDRRYFGGAEGLALIVRRHVSPRPPIVNEYNFDRGCSFNPKYFGP